MEPKKRQITVVAEAIIVLFKSALWNLGSLRTWTYSAPVGFLGRIVGGEAKSSVLVMMLILKTQMSGNTLTNTKTTRNT
jgi:TRAP-type uncharacterized transport system fused permease subunit